MSLERYSFSRCTLACRDSVDLFRRLGSTEIPMVRATFLWMPATCPTRTDEAPAGPAAPGGGRAAQPSDGKGFAPVGSLAEQGRGRPPSSPHRGSPADLPRRLVEPRGHAPLPVLVEVRLQDHAIPAGRHGCCLRAWGRGERVRARATVLFRLRPRPEQPYTDGRRWPRMAVDGSGCDPTPPKTPGSTTLTSSGGERPAEKNRRRKAPWDGTGLSQSKAPKSSGRSEPGIPEVTDARPPRPGRTWRVSPAAFRTRGRTGSTAGGYGAPRLRRGTPRPGESSGALRAESFLRPHVTGLELTLRVCSQRGVSASRASSRSAAQPPLLGGGVSYLPRGRAAGAENAGPAADCRLHKTSGIERCQVAGGSSMTRAPASPVLQGESRKPPFHPRNPSFPPSPQTPGFFVIKLSRHSKS
ncbi:translation initiation factor IF-2-like [Ailuropoda melanoleuca]|uniref:translation initiation factor IF-2-like n=1 Tax=Ailuropoda melanoleuca TaxID=9646 RepID=UPI001494771E|nr:translation initiation factor IF-2-like [Ailuropoda melanoleuca]